MAKIALVGAAHIHTPGFIKMIQARQDVQVQCVWDHDAARAARRATELNVPAIADLGQVWSNREISAVVICSETNRHEPLVLAATAAGKHLFVEKPLGMGARDAYAMADAIEKAGVMFQTGYFRRSDPIHQFLRDQIRKGVFGKITRARGSICHGGALGGWFDSEWRWMADPKQAGCGAFGDLGTHSLDILIWLLGEIDSVAATLDPGTRRYPNCDETGESLIRFKNGAIGTLAAAWDDLANPVDLLISGTEAHAIVIRNQLFFQARKIEGADGKQPWTDLPHVWPHAFAVFLDAINGTRTGELVTAREAAYRSAVMEAMYQSARDHSWSRIDHG